MRFTVLCASAALASSLMLSACSGGTNSSSAIPGGATASTKIGHNTGGYHLVRLGIHTDQTCQSPFTECYEVNAGSTNQVGWCISTTTSCTSGVYAGKVQWFNEVPEATCMPAQTYYLKKNKCVGKVKSVWGPPKTAVGVVYDNVTTKPTVRSTKGEAGYDATFNACATSGSNKGNCYGPIRLGIIVN